MAYNGSGTFSIINTFVYDTVISETDMNTNFSDVATGLSTAITKDGQTTTTAAIPFASGLNADTISELTGAVGVTVDGVLLKDGKADTTKGADIASATTTDIGAATGNYVNITGTTTITGLGAIAAGAKRSVQFDGILTLTHDGASLILPGGANITTAAGDTAGFVSLGSGNWICEWYSRANGASATGLIVADIGVTVQAYNADTNLENLLIGGIFAANPWQRGTSITAATSFVNNDAVYTADQWVLLSDGNDIVDVSQDTDSSLLATVQTANKQFGFSHIVRADNAAIVMGDVISAAVSAKASGIVTLRLAVLTWDGAADAPTRDLVSAWAGGGSEPTWATNWTREGTIVDLTLGASYASVKADNVSLDTASGKQFAVVVWIDDTDAAVSDTLNIEWVSAVAAPAHPVKPPARLASSERELCRKEFRLLVGTSSEVVGMGYQIDGTTGIIFLDISMLEIPAISVSSASHFTFFPDNIVTTSITANAVSTKECFGINIVVASGFAANAAGALQSSSGSALLYLTCEL